MSGIYTKLDRPPVRAGNRTAAAHGGRLVRELEAVHEALRRDLAECRALARTGHALHELRARCLSHCRFVSLHQHIGGVRYPALLRSHPELAGVIRELSSGHALVLARLRGLRAAAAPLAPDEAGRGRIAQALEELEAQLLPLLESEEAALSGPLSGLHAWPG